MKIMDFVQEMKERAKNELLKVSEEGKCVGKTREFKTGKAEIITIKGGALEKASITHLVLKGIKPPGSDKVSDGIVYQMEVFPEMLPLTWLIFRLNLSPRPRREPWVLADLRANLFG